MRWEIWINTKNIFFLLKFCTKKFFNVHIKKQIPLSCCQGFKFRLFCHPHCAEKKIPKLFSRMNFFLNFLLLLWDHPTIMIYMHRQVQWKINKYVVGLKLCVVSWCVTNGNLRIQWKKKTAKGKKWKTTKKIVTNAKVCLGGNFVFLTCCFWVWIWFFLGIGSKDQK